MTEALFLLIFTKKTALNVQTTTMKGDQAPKNVQKTLGDLEAEKLYEILSDIKTETLVDALDDMVAKYKPRDTW